MKNLADVFGAFLRNEDGATAIEYSLIAGLIAIGCIAALILAGDEIVELFNGVATKVTAAVSGT